MVTKCKISYTPLYSVMTGDKASNNKVYYAPG